MKAEEMTAKH